eukprot:6515487-Prymnesium_polylepis.1
MAASSFVPGKSGQFDWRLRQTAECPSAHAPVQSLLVWPGAALYRPALQFLGAEVPSEHAWPTVQM